MKLLAKTAEERYQTAAGLEHDLRRCLGQWEDRGDIDRFSLGERDVPDRLLIPERLYGREREIEKLLAAFDRIVAGNGPELVLVAGQGGVGKSAVVAELHRALVPPRGMFASGKFDQLTRDIPYASVAQALVQLIKPLFGKSEAELTHWRTALTTALGPNGALMVTLVPELELLIGAQPPAPELPPRDAQRQFQLVLRRLLAVFARPEHPLALFLDDLQWLDAATLDVLEDLLTQPELTHLLIVGAYRDDEVTPAHPLRLRLAGIREAGGRVQEIILNPLELDDVTLMMAESLHSQHVRPLARLVHEKTAGNPFFAIQFVTALADEGLLAFDRDAARWGWDLKRIRAKDYTDNVVDFMLGKLRLLPATYLRGPATASLPRQRCAGGYPGARPERDRRCRARHPSAGGASATLVATRGRLPVSARPRAGSGVCADPGERASCGAPCHRPAARSADPAECGRGERVRDRRTTQPWERAHQRGQGARAACRAEPDCRPARQELDGVLVGVELSHRRQRPVASKRLGTSSRSRLRARAPPGRMRISHECAR